MMFHCFIEIDRKNFPPIRKSKSIDTVEQVLQCQCFCVLICLAKKSAIPFHEIKYRSRHEPDRVERGKLWEQVSFMRFH